MSSKSVEFIIKRSKLLLYHEVETLHVWNKLDEDKNLLKTDNTSYDITFRNVYLEGCTFTNKTIM